MSIDEKDKIEQNLRRAGALADFLSCIADEPLPEAESIRMTGRLILEELRNAVETVKRL